MKTIKLVLVVLLSIAIASCGGGGGGGATTTQTLSGTAAQGAPIASATITIKGANGVKVTATTDATGKYPAKDVSSLTAPYLLQVTTTAGTNLYSVATATGTANIHPFTDLIIRNWYKVQGSNVETDFSGASALAKVPTATEINTIEAVVRSILSTYLTNVGITTSNFNLLSSSFDANHTGFDKVLDNTQVVVSTAGAVTVTATDPTTGITGTMVSTDSTINLAAADTTKPTGPSGLSAIPASTTSIVLVWNASTDNVGVAGYNIYRGTTKVGTSPYPVFSDTGLISGTHYCYQVEAFDGAGNVSAKSPATAVCATTLAAADTTAPSAPTGLTATVASASQIDLSWTASASTDVAGYAIYRGVTKIATVTATSYSDTGLSSATLYSYTVEALDGALNYSVASTASATTQAGIPSAPASVTASAGDGQVTISWNAVSGATSYNIYRSTTSGVTKASGTKITGATSPYVQASLANGTTYYYVVTAVNSSGESVESAQVSATPTTAGAGVSQFDGIYTGTIIGIRAEAGIPFPLTFTVDNGVFTVIDPIEAGDTGTVSGSGAITASAINSGANNGCAGTDTFTGQITLNSSGVAAATGSHFSTGTGVGGCIDATSTWTATRNYAGTYSGTLTTTSAGSGTFSVTVDSAGVMNGSIYFNGATAVLSGQETSGGIVSFMLSGKTDTYSGTINAATGAFAAACTSGCVDNPVFTGVKQATVGAAFPIANTSVREVSAGAAFDGTNFLVGIQGDGTLVQNITAQFVSKTGALVGSRISLGTVGVPAAGGAPGIAFDGTNYLLVWGCDATLTTCLTGQFVSTSGALVGAPFTIASGYNNIKSMTQVIFDGTNYFVDWDNEGTPCSGTPNVVCGGDTKDVYGQFVTPSGTLLGSAIPISTAVHGQRDPFIAFDGTNILVAWTDGRNQSACFTNTVQGTFDGEVYQPGTHCFESDIYGQFITKSGASAAGALSGSNFQIDAGTLPRDSSGPGVAFDGTNYLITYTEETTLPNACSLSGCIWETYGIIVSKAGAAIGSRFALGNPAINHKFFPLPVYLGTQYLVTWTDGMGTTSASVKGQYVTTSGAVSGSEFTLLSPAASGAVPWLGMVFTGGGVNLAITDGGIPDATDPANIDLYTGADVMGSIITTP